MRAAVNAFALWCAAAALQAAPSVSLADDEARSANAEETSRAVGSGQAGADRWVPSLSVVGGVSVWDWSGSVASEFCAGCTLPSSMSTPLRDSATGNDRDVTPFVGGTLELMSPELPIPTSPRLFIGGEVSATFGFDRKIAQEGAAGELETPFPIGVTDRPIAQGSLLGQGSETLAQLSSPLYGAYLGVAFPLEIYGRPLRIKPAFTWVHYDVDVSGLVVSAICRDVLDQIPPGTIVPTKLCNTITVGGTQVDGYTREVRLQGGATGSYNGIGPGIDFEMDTGVLGPVGTSLFFGARVYYILGERDLQFGNAATYDDLAGGVDQAAAQWSFSVDPWMYRLALGMRFQWLGSHD